MDDLTDEYFARMNFISAVEWLLKFQDIKKMTISALLKDQAQKAHEIKKKIENSHYAL